MDHSMMMGDLPGHIFPGLAFLVWALVWCAALVRRAGSALENPWGTRPDPVLERDAAASAPWESWLKIIVPLVEISFELRWITWPMTAESTTIYAHITADVAVILSGAADLMVARRRLPAGTDRLALALAFFVPGLLFATHGQHGPIAATAHALFAWLLFAASALVLIEHVRPAPLFRWLRVYAVALAGVWFMHTGWLLYVSGYDLMSDALSPRVYLFFAWYALGVGAALGGALATYSRRT